MENQQRHPDHSFGAGTYIPDIYMSPLTTDIHTGPLKLNEPFDCHPERLHQEASNFIAQMYEEAHCSERYASRMRNICQEFAATGTYTQTSEELLAGAKLAWRNNTRCIGRLHWKSLPLRDMRALETAEEIFEACVDHIRIATNGGKLKQLVTVFAPTPPGKQGIRIWNSQLIRYAGYRQPDGSILGDPISVPITDMLMKHLGWKGGERTPFDLLPLVIQTPGKRPQVFELPPSSVLEIPLSHPDFSWFAKLGLKWYALPAIANMRMEIGGVNYTAAPFSGWYMGTEIGARNLGDVDRYNLLPTVARGMGLDTRSDRTLWKDRALIELNVAVLHSFTQHGVTMIDHHAASRQFLMHDQLEQQAGRTTPTHWTWIVPPISGSACPVFHHTTFKNTIQTPNFFYQRAPWKGEEGH